MNDQTCAFKIFLESVEF